MPRGSRPDQVRRINNRLIVAEPDRWRTRPVGSAGSSPPPRRLTAPVLVACAVGGIAVLLGLSGSVHGWAAVVRGSGLIALGCLLLTGLATVATAVPPLRRLARPTHRWLGSLGALATVVHVLTTTKVPALGIGWLQTVVPFTRAAGPLPQACGVLATYLLAAVLVSVTVRGRLPRPWWRRLHLLAWPMTVLSCVHAALAATVAAAGWATVVAALAAPMSCVAAWRYARRPNEVRAAATPRTPPVLPADPAQGWLPLRIAQMTWEAEGVMSLLLASSDGFPLPPWRPGSHLKVRLPSGRVRHYSLYGDPEDNLRYRVAVLLKPDGQGGSREIHEQLRVGNLLPVQAPRNGFELSPAPAYLLIAGGIGITCMLPMACRLSTEALSSSPPSTAAPWQLVYAGRSRDRMALLDQVEELDAGRVRVVPEDEQGRVDLAALLDEQAPGTAVYCCGPPGMIEAVTALVADRPGLSVHTERFAAAAPSEPSGPNRPVQLELQRSGRTVEVPSDQPLLQALAPLAPDVTGGCEQGICGQCTVRVLSGEPDHRDGLLSARERAAGKMLPCVSRAHSDRLVLDL